MKTKQRILKAILHNGAMSRAALSDELGISPSRISEVTGLMMKEGIIIKSGYGDSSGRGRKETLLDISDSCCFALGIGLTPGVICAGITTVKGETIENRCISLAEAGYPADISSYIRELCRDMMKNCCLSQERLLGVGICQDMSMPPALGKDEMASFPMPVLIEPADKYLEYSSAYIPINPAEMYMFGCAKVIRDIFLGDG